MGLDMYLTKRIYVKNWSHTEPERRYEISITRGGAPLPTATLDPAKVTYITQEVAYWRKANAIHRWFVENVQNGNDDCGDYYVSQEQLQELLDVINNVLAASKMTTGAVRVSTELHLPTGTWFDNMEEGEIIEDTSVAEALLPTQGGFFFGGTDYDQYYYEDLEETKAMLEEALKDTEGDFYYHASW